MEPRAIIRDIEDAKNLPLGNGDRFAGYAVIGLTFRSGHVLAMRRFPRFLSGSGIHIGLAPKPLRQLDVPFHGDAGAGMLPVFRRRRSTKRRRPDRSGVDRSGDLSRTHRRSRLRSRPVICGSSSLGFLYDIL